MLRRLNRFFLFIPIIIFSGDLAFSGNGKFLFYFFNNDTFNFLTMRNVTDFSINKEIRDYTISSNLRFLMDNEMVYDTITYIGLSRFSFFLIGEKLNLKMGDVYFSIGRGLSFSTFDDDKVRINRSLFGLLINFSERFSEINLFSGFLKNIFLIDTLSSFSGIETKIKPFKNLTFGVHYMMQNAMNRSFKKTFGMVVQEIYGLYGFLKISNFDIYSEYILRHTYGEYNPVYGWVGSEDVKGSGFYSSLTFNILGFGLNLGVKDYKRLNSGINLPPPLNKVERLINEGYDEKGFEGGLNINPFENIEISCDYAYSYGLNQYLSDFLSEFIYDFELFEVNFEGRYRKEKGLEFNIESKKMYGVDIEISSLSINDISIKLKAGFNRYSNIYSTGDFSYLEFSSNTEVNLNIGIFIICDITKATNEVPEYENKDFWWELGTGLRVDGGKKNISFSYLNTKGGIICAGGICRYEPSFKGYKLNFEINF